MQKYFLTKPYFLIARLFLKDKIYSLKLAIVKEF